MTKEKKLKELEKLKQKRNKDLENNDIVYEALDSTLKSNKINHVPLYAGLKVQRIFSGYKLHVLNETPKYYKNEDGEELEVFVRPVIFAPNHVRKKDIEMIMEALKRQVILLSGDFENVHGTFSGSALEKNGIIYFDMEDKLDRKNVREVEKQVLNKNQCLLKFFEASWNLSPNLLLYKGYYSLVQTAIDTNALVIPVAFEQPVKFDMTDKDIYIKFGKPIDYSEIYCDKTPYSRVVIKRELSHEEKKEAIENLRSDIATLLYDIFSEYCNEKRDDLPEGYFEKYKEKVLSEWYFNEDDISKKHFVDKSVVEQEDAFKHLKDIDLSKSSAFLFSKRNHH